MTRGRDWFPKGITWFTVSFYYYIFSSKNHPYLILSATTATTTCLPVCLLPRSKYKKWGSEKKKEANKKRMQVEDEEFLPRCNTSDVCQLRCILLIHIFYVCRLRFVSSLQFEFIPILALQVMTLFEICFFYVIFK